MVELVQVHIDHDTCVGSGTCAMVDPAHFTMVDGKGTPPPDPVATTEDLEDAVLDCPVQAITSQPG